MKKEEIIWFRDQEYQILAVEHPSPEEETEKIAEIEEMAEPAEPAVEQVAGISIKNRYIIQDRKVKREEKQADGSCRYKACTYSGGLLVARGLNAIPLSKENPSCYHYEVVVELIVENGNVTALIDHSRAMKKIAKNLEYQLRSLKKRRDVYVIRRFLKRTFVRKYPVNWVQRG